MDIGTMYAPNQGDRERKEIGFELEEQTENDSIRLPMIIMIFSILHIFQNFEVRMSTCNSCDPDEDHLNLWIYDEEVRDNRAWRMDWVTPEETRIADKGPLINASITLGAKVIGS